MDESRDFQNNRKWSGREIVNAETKEVQSLLSLLYKRLLKKNVSFVIKEKPLLE